MKPRVAQTLKLIARMYPAAGVAVVIYTVGLYAYVLIWMPRGRLHNFGIAVGGAYSVAFVGALALLGFGLLLCGAYALRRETPPDAVLYVLVLAVVLLLGDFVLLPAIVG
jgi:hypothetical protein